MTKCKLSRLIPFFILELIFITAIFLPLLTLSAKLAQAAAPLAFTSTDKLALSSDQAAFAKMIASNSVLSTTEVGTTTVNRGSSLQAVRDIGMLEVTFLLTKTAFPTSGTTIRSGERITYTLRVKNNGDSTANDIVVTDTLPAGVSLLFSSTNRGVITSVGPTIIWTIGDLGTVFQPAARLTVSVNVSQVITAVNQFQLGSQQIPLASSNSVTHTLVPLIVTLDSNKTAFPAPGSTVTTGQKITYTLSVKNSGNTTANSVRLTDTLPAGVNLISNSIDQGTLIREGPLITWNIGVLEENQLIKGRLLVMVNVSRSTVITNQFRVDSHQTFSEFSNKVVHYLSPLRLHLPIILKFSPPSILANPGFETIPNQD